MWEMEKAESAECARELRGIKTAMEEMMWMMRGMLELMERK